MATPFIQTVGGRKTTQYSDLFPMAASAVIKVAYGRFVTASSGYYAISTGSSTQIDGWVDNCYKPDHSGTYTRTNASGFTCSSTNGGTVLSGTKSISTPDDAKWIPGKITLTASHIGTICDLDVTTDNQTVDPGTTARSHVKILDVDTVNNMALVYAVK